MSKIIKRRFRDFPIWFVLHYEDGELIALEEHDWYAGGHIGCYPNMTFAETFIARVAVRMPGYEDDAKKFLLEGTV